jgi:quercetin dioxygenase-like cupin family protein
MSYALDTVRQQGVELADRALEFLAGLRRPEVTSFLEDWPAQSTPRSVIPSSVPALRWLPRLHDAAPNVSIQLVGAVVTAAHSLAWRRSYSPELVGAEFFDHYGWTELLGLTGPAASDHLACGVLLLGPHQTYPPHRHEAEEIYVPLAGAAAWQQGTDRWRERPPGDVIHHASNEPHAMRTGATPLLALYLWRSENLAQSSQLDPAPGPTLAR